MTAVAQLTVGPVERALLGAGLWTLTGRVPPGLEVDPDELASHELQSRLFARAFEDKMLPMLARYAAARGWELPAEELTLVEVYRQKMAALYEDLEPLVEELTRHGVEVMILKGSDLALTAYPPDLPRMMADIDLLVKPPYLPVAAAVFRAAGYVQGRIDMAALRITPLTEAEAQAIADSHYELAPFIRIRPLPGLTPMRETVDARLKGSFFTVLGREVFFGQGYDVHFNVSDNIDVADLWRWTRPVRLPSGREMEAQSPTALLWFLTARAYHEMMLADVPSIRLFVDVLAALVAHGHAVDWDWLLDVGHKYDLEPSLFYLFRHANDLLGPVVPEKVIAACRPDRPGVSRFHDWGDPVPKLLSTVAVASVLAAPSPSLSLAANVPQPAARALHRRRTAERRSR